VSFPHVIIWVIATSTHPVSAESRDKKASFGKREICDHFP
jgi:hypothetical protein